jgi:hypothetical protein
MIDFIFKVIGFLYRLCFGVTVWVGLYLVHKIFMSQLKEYDMIGERPEFVYWITFIGFVYLATVIIRRMSLYDKEEETTHYERSKRQGNFSSLGNLDDRYGESIDPKSYRGK